MHKQLFTIFDSKSQTCDGNFLSITLATAIRSFSEACNQEGHQYNKYGSDFTLFHLGEQDLNTMKITELTAPLSLGTAISFIIPDVDVVDAGMPEPVRN